MNRHDLVGVAMEIAVVAFVVLVVVAGPPRDAAADEKAQALADARQKAEKLFKNNPDPLVVRYMEANKK